MGRKRKLIAPQIGSFVFVFILLCSLDDIDITYPCSIVFVLKKDNSVLKDYIHHAWPTLKAPRYLYFHHSYCDINCFGVIPTSFILNRQTGIWSSNINSKGEFILTQRLPMNIRRDIMEHWNMMPSVLVDLITNYAITYVAFTENAIDQSQLKIMLQDENVAKVWQQRIDFQKEQNIEPGVFQCRQCWSPLIEK